MKQKLLIFFYGSYLNLLAWISPVRAGKIGFYLFCRPRRRAVKPHHLEFLNTAEKFSVLYEGKNVQAYRWGTGDKKLLLLHGWESHSYWWKRMVTRLLKENEYTIYSLDAPGHGLSEGSYVNIPHYSGLIEKVIGEQGPMHAVLGHSLGAFSTAYTFYRLPTLSVNKLVLMASPGEVTQFVQFYKAVLGLSDRTMGAIEDFFVKKLGHGPGYFSLKTFVMNFSMEGLLVHDKDDNEAPYKNILEVNKNWKTSRLITTTGLGHNLKSDELIEDVVKFL